MATRNIRVCDVLGTPIKDDEAVYCLSEIWLGQEADGAVTTTLFQQCDLSDISEEGAERLVKILESLKNPIKRRKRKAKVADVAGTTTTA